MKRLVIQPVNGLMNRFRAIASARILAEHTGRQLEINWIPEHCCNIRIEDIVKGGFFRNADPINTKDVYFHSGPQKGSEHPFVPEMIEAENEILYLLAGGNFFPHDMPLSEFNRKKSEFYRSIPFKDSISDPAERFLKENGPYFGMHLRFTDRSQFAAPLSYVISQIKEHPDRKFFICSDDRRFIDHLRSEFGQRILSYDITNLNRSSPDALMQSMIDWLILSKSEKIWYSMGSSFSYEACIPGMLSESIEMNPNGAILNDFILNLEF